MKFLIVLISFLAFDASPTPWDRLQCNAKIYPRPRRKDFRRDLTASFAAPFRRKSASNSRTSGRRFGPIRPLFHCTSVDESRSIDYDALEMEDAKGRSARSIHKLEVENVKRRAVRSLNGKSKKSKNRARTIDRCNDKPSVIEKYQPSRDKRKFRRRSKRYLSGSAKLLPPWLARYENVDIFDPFGYENGNNSIYGNHDHSNFYTKNNDLLKCKAEMQKLQLAMSGIFYHPLSNSASSHPHSISSFTPLEIHEVLDSIRVAAKSNSNLMAGCAEFLYLMLTLEEEGVLKSNFLKGHWSDGNRVLHDELMEKTEVNDNFDDEPHSIMTRDVLVAAAFHYCDCVRARKAGVYDYVRQAMEASLNMGMWKELERRQELWLSPAVSDDKEVMTDYEEQIPNTPIDVNAEVDVTSSFARHRGNSAIGDYGEESKKIAAGAARIKRAEIMATTVNSKAVVTESTKQSTLANKMIRRKQISTKEDSSILRSFLVTLSEDWRSLVIRSVACLYRLKGIVEDESMSSSGSVVLSRTTLRTAKDALLVYAPLAQRLGMQRLKSELENTAFQILYRRQYSVASALYTGEIDDMKTIIQVLSSRIEQLLRSDPIFIDQVDEVSVSSRVKEPYSLWRKMLRYRWDAAKAKTESAKRVMEDDLDSNDGNSRSNAMISIKLVPDAIALRVIFRAMKMSASEDDESLRTREKMLCYYALKLISDVWPVSNANCPKDYIKNPKPNGYQSLHYTASLMIGRNEWPFEVQIRSEEMHRIAEYGVAAHWDYKLTNKSLPSDASPDNNKYSSGLALPASGSDTASFDEDELDVEESLETILAGKLNTSAQETTRKSRIASYIEALTTSRENIVRQNLFVFLSSTRSALDGRIVSVDPSKSTVRDVLSKYGSLGIEESDFEVYQNGIRTTLAGELSNGDVLTVPWSVIDDLFLE